MARASARLRGEHTGKVLDVGQLPTAEPYSCVAFDMSAEKLRIVITRNF